MCLLVVRVNKALLLLLLLSVLLIEWWCLTIRVQISVKMSFSQAHCTLNCLTSLSSACFSYQQQQQHLLSIMGVWLFQPCSWLLWSSATFTEPVGAKSLLVEITREICWAKLPVRCKTRTRWKLDDAIFPRWAAVACLGQVLSQCYNTTSADCLRAL